MTPETRMAIESILMVADQPVEATVLAQLLEVPKADIESACDTLAAEYVASGRGFILARIAGGYRFQSHPEQAPYVERFVLDGQSSRLSTAALETLAIVAYKQPISRMQVAAIRGVNVDGVLRTLQQRGYVDEVSRDPGPGNAVMYGTTSLFLERVGVHGLDDLPALAGFVPGADVVEALEEGLRPEPITDLAAEAAAMVEVEQEHGGPEPAATTPDTEISERHDVPADANEAGEVETAGSAGDQTGDGDAPDTGDALVADGPVDDDVITPGDGDAPDTGDALVADDKDDDVIDLDSRGSADDDVIDLDSRGSADDEVMRQHGTDDILGASIDLSAVDDGAAGMGVVISPMPTPSVISSTLRHDIPAPLVSPEHAPPEDSAAEAEPDPAESMVSFRSAPGDRTGGPDITTAAGMGVGEGQGQDRDPAGPPLTPDRD